ncbi:MAG TPA: nucleoside hydrolase [Candidatus Limnocylindria bacterium]|nr:nucleoside hydrolase [Candidatus Limnocylindria bacterium]
MPDRRRVILDCDPGHDDAIAILLAAASPALELEAITTVAGNQTLDKVTLNARRVCSVAGITEVPIAAGADRPLARAPIVAGEIHGTSGLDGVDWDEPTVGVDSRAAVDLIVERALADDPRPLTIVAVGPLTNVATALRDHPEIRPRIERISVMGGAIGLGNWSPSAEFNIIVDPEASEIVLESGVPVTLVPLEVTHQALATDPVLERIAALGTPVSRMADALLRFFADTYRDVFGFAAPAVHDPCAVAAIIDPTIVGTRRTNVAIETRSELTLGRTVVDVYGTTGRPPNADVGMDLRVDRFWDLVIEALATYR